MELYSEILIELLKKEEINIVFPNLKINSVELFENECYKTLKKIKIIIEDDTLQILNVLKKSFAFLKI